jgi:hypothetical protein
MNPFEAAIEKFDRIQAERDPRHQGETGSKVTDSPQKVEVRGSSFIVRDSGKRQQFEGGMMRDTQEGKLDIWRVFVGPLVERLADHLTKGAAKYPDVTPGVPNWTLAAGEEEMQRFKASAARHFWQWFRGDVDEDHFAAVAFNMNGYEALKEKLK